MAEVRPTFDPLNPPTLDEKFHRRMDASTPEQIEENALANPDNPPMTEDEFQRVAFAQRVRAVRRRLGMTAEAFTAAYSVPLDRLSEMESGTAEMDSIVAAYIDVIDALSGVVAELVVQATRRQ